MLPIRSPPRPRALARAALGALDGAEVLVAADDAEVLGATLVSEGARVTPVSLGPVPAGGPDAWGSIDLPTWTFDALLAEGLLSRASDLEAVLYRLRAWIRPGAPFALLEPVAPPAWDLRAPLPAGALSMRDVELVRRHLPGMRVTRLPLAEAGATWADALRSAVEPWFPALARGVRLAVLSGRFPP